MKIPLSDVPAVVATFLETELLPKAVGMMDKAKVSAMIAVVVLRGKDLVNEPSMVHSGKLLGVIDEAGMFDMDYFVRFADETFKRTPTVELFGMTFCNEDAKTLHRIAQGTRR